MAAWCWGAAALLLAGCASAAGAQQTDRSAAERARERAAAEREVGRWTASELVTFRSEEDFRSYLRAVERAQQVRWASANARRLQLAAAQAQPGQEQGSDSPAQVCPEDDKECLRRELQGDEAIVVTGASVSPPPLTNNQELGVDEGDIVKQIGRYLLILQDGRIFVVDTEAGAGRGGLELVDRADVYRHPSEDAWYDELVVHGDRVVVTGYSYRVNASEIAVFRLGEGGRLTREAVFQIKSADYYTRDNYAARVVGDRLVLYTPLPVQELNSDKIEWPRLRRVPAHVRGGEPDMEEEAAAFRGANQLLRPERLHRPLATLADPMIHMVTSCDLGALSRAGGGALGCESQAFVGPPGRHFYVAGEQGYLWTWGGAEFSGDDGERPDCAPAHRTAAADTHAALVYRVSIAGGPMAVVSARGIPFDQLGLDASGGRFRALVAWNSRRCDTAKNMPLAYFNIADATFGRRLRPAGASAYMAMPDIGAQAVENRFTDRFLVFGGRPQRSYWSDEPSLQGFAGGGDAVVVPIDRPQEATRVRVPHRVWRAERVGDNVVLTGYGDAEGLDLSLIDLAGAAPRVASTIQLEGRFESEGRSHAFNSSVGEDGSGLIGLPTVVRVGDSDRYVWRSSAADISFLSLDAAGQLQTLGALEAQAESGGRWGYGGDDADPDAGYACEVSCIDWYGNSRPLFTRGRVFGLTATELVEGRVARGRIGEVQRIDLTKAPLPPHLRRAGPPDDEEAVAAPGTGAGE